MTQYKPIRSYCVGGRCLCYLRLYEERPSPKDFDCENIFLRGPERVLCKKVPRIIGGKRAIPLCLKYVFLSKIAASEKLKQTFIPEKDITSFLGTLEPEGVSNL